MPRNPGTRGGPANDAVHRELTVAHIRGRQGADFVEVMFFQSARIYRLLRSNERFDQLLSQLHQSRTAGDPVRITLAGAYSDVIENVEGF